MSVCVSLCVRATSEYSGWMQMCVGKGLVRKERKETFETSHNSLLLFFNEGI